MLSLARWEAHGIQQHGSSPIRLQRSERVEFWWDLVVMGVGGACSQRSEWRSLHPFHGASPASSPSSAARARGRVLQLSAGVWGASHFHVLHVHVGPLSPPPSRREACLGPRCCRGPGGWGRPVRQAPGKDRDHLILRGAPGAVCSLSGSGWLAGGVTVGDYEWGLQGRGVSPAAGEAGTWVPQWDLRPGAPSPQAGEREVQEAQQERGPTLGHRPQLP